jgi:hypothetical protein
MKDVLCYELGPIPWAIITASGSLIKTNKATLPKLLEIGASIIESRPNVSVCIIDVMGVIQSLKRIPDTFG